MFSLVFKLNPIVPCLGLSNEILCILVLQRATKLPEVKIRGPIKKGEKHG